MKKDIPGITPQTKGGIFFSILHPDGKKLEGGVLTCVENGSN
jgi:hypothetical protein